MLVKKTVREAGMVSKQLLVSQYLNIVCFLVKIGLAKEEVFFDACRMDMSSCWYIPAIGNFKSDGWVAIGNCEINLIEIDGQMYWTVVVKAV